MPRNGKTLESLVLAYLESLAGSGRALPSRADRLRSGNCDNWDGWDKWERERGEIGA